MSRLDAHTLCKPDYLARGVERLSRGDVVWASGPQLAEGTDLVAARRARASHAARDRRGELSRRGSRDRGRRGLSRGVAPRNAARARRLGRVLADQTRTGSSPRGSPQGTDGSSVSRRWRSATSPQRPPCLDGPVAPGLALTTLAAALPLRLVARRARHLRGGGGDDRGLQGALRWPPRRRFPASVLPTMHLSWGFGFLLGAVRFGPPFAALARLLRGLLPG